MEGQKQCDVTHSLLEDNTDLRVTPKRYDSLERIRMMGNCLKWITCTFTALILVCIFCLD